VRAAADADGCAEYPNLPLRYADSVIDISTKRREILVPAELCDIVAGTAYMGKLDGDETARMIRHACKDPVMNATAIVSVLLPQLGLAPADAPHGPLAVLGITVSGGMTTFTARVLPPQSLKITRTPLVKNLDRNRNPSFALVLLSMEDNYIHPGVKRLGDGELGVNTVCMLLPRKALVPDVKKRDQYYSNVALKVHFLLPSFIVTSS
jgi:hypothetical protein